MKERVAHPEVYIGDEALPRLVAFCREHALSRFALVADRNTYAALGRAAEAALADSGCDVLTILLEGDDIGVDATYVFDTMLALDRVPRTFLAVGSGTVTDVTRFVSHRLGREFISLPTAPSVDGYTSVGAPMVIHGVKRTVSCHGPLAVFAHLPTLCAAPRPMLAAGFGDMLAKLTSSADWEIGSLLWGERYDPEIARRGRAAAWACAHAVDSIAAAGCDGVTALMDGLIESGFCMLDFGDTLPASGNEHHTSHLWEMKLLREGRHSVLHGAKVGLAVIGSLRRYNRLAALSRPEVEALLAGAGLPDREAALAEIQAAFGPLADEVIATDRPFLDLTPAQLEALKARILAHWDEIHRIAAELPSADQMIAWVKQVGGPTTGRELGFGDEEIRLGLTASHHFRHRFTGAKLCYFLGLPLAA